MPELLADGRRHGEQLFAAGAGLLGADLRDLGRREPHHRAARDPRRSSSQRVEYRIAAADINPYIALAAAIGSGLWGIEHRIEPDAAIEGNAYDREHRRTGACPRHSTRRPNAWPRPRAARALFGDAFVEHYAATRQWEEREFRKAITDWELARYFEII